MNRYLVPEVFHGVNWLLWTRTKLCWKIALEIQLIWWQMVRHYHLFPAHIHQYAFHPAAHAPELVLLCDATWIFTLQSRYSVIKWKHFPYYWPFVQGIHRSLLNYPHKGQWRGALMFLFMYAWINGWVNNQDTGDLRRHRPHYDITVMKHDDILPTDAGAEDALKSVQGIVPACQNDILHYYISYWYWALDISIKILIICC